jgi:hypothetical protein
MKLVLIAVGLLATTGVLCSLRLLLSLSAEEAKSPLCGRAF